jgi:hypothetical protein
MKKEYLTPQQLDQLRRREAVRTHKLLGGQGASVKPPESPTET